MQINKQPEELRNGYKDKARLAAIHDKPCVNCIARNRMQQSKTIAHHKIGMGLGKKASDKLTIALCEDCHTGPRGIHNVPLKKWESENLTQDQLIEMTNKFLGE